MAFPFAKLFDTAFGQVLFTKEDENNIAKITMRGEGNACYYPEIEASFESEESREIAFSQITQDFAEKVGFTLDRQLKVYEATTRLERAN